MMNARQANPDPEMIRLIMALRRQGITDRRVLSAMEQVPRADFIPPVFSSRAHEDKALPIECGQTISQPYIVAYMSEQLRVTDRCKVLEVGTGSGYQTAILCRLARRVYSIERYRTLARAAEARLAELGLTNVTLQTGDGFLGWPAQAPFDRIMVTAATPAIPEALMEQLKPGGCMIIPVEGDTGGQVLVRVTRAESGEDQPPQYKKEALIPVRFVPLVEGVAKET